MRIVFIVLAALSVVSAVGSILVKRVMRGALLLGVYFLGIAGLFAALGQDFLAIVQVLVNAGAVTVLFLFATMLSERREITGKQEAQPVSLRGLWLTKTAPLVVVVIFMGLLGRLIIGGTAIPVNTLENLHPLHSAADIGRLLFGEYLLPLEITSVILLAALIGALVLVRRGDEE